MVSAPSGTGKSTLCNNLRQTPDFVYSISATTRPPRQGEEEGIDYYFLSLDEFKKKIKKDEFLEYVENYGHYYGTMKKHVFDLLDDGKDVLLNIEVQGARALRALPDARIREALVDVFIMPPTQEELEKRLRKRGTETEEEVQKRMKIAAKEMSLWQEYKYTILSSSMEEDLAKFRAIMKAERYLSRRLKLQNVQG